MRDDLAGDETGTVSADAFDVGGVVAGTDDGGAVGYAVGGAVGYADGWADVGGAVGGAVEWADVGGAVEGADVCGIVDVDVGAGDGGLFDGVETAGDLRDTVETGDVTNKGTAGALYGDTVEVEFAIFDGELQGAGWIF